MPNKNLLSKASQISLLPQYQNSETMYDRFSSATLEGSQDIIRSKNLEKIKLTDIYEIENDHLKYFINKKSDFETEFFNTLSLKISENRANLFCNIISQYWYDGKTKRQSEEVKRLFASIKNYFLQYRFASCPENIRVLNELEPSVETNFEDSEIKEIIMINKMMVSHYMQEWLENRHDYLETNFESLHCRRGLYLEKIFNNGDEYYEWDFINSYSIGFTVTEKFAQINKSKIPVIINKNLSDVLDRIIFFAPFIPGMPIHQFELGLIPHTYTMRCKNQGKYGGIHEFFVE